MTLIIDFDGTLIDSKKRCLDLFQKLTNCDDAFLSAYENLKSLGISNLEILDKQFSYTEVAREAFQEIWLSEVESEQNLRKDVLIPGVLEWLESSFKVEKLILCSARQNEEAAIAQLVELGVFQYFSNVLITQQTISKPQAILNSGLSLKPTDWIIGDSPDDLLTGTALKIKSAFVSTGFRKQETVLKYNPTMCVSAITEFRLTEQAK